ncbi:MAG: thiamine-monophosphate kinase [Thermoproteus sp.]|nr:thiamine-monophosphate kinase [Thermoproteus sp.]
MGLREKELLASFLSALGEEDNDVYYLDSLALKIDGFAESKAKMPFHTYEDLGWRAVAAALSDLKVKLAEPLAVAVSITAPDAARAEAVFRGAAEAAHKFGVRYAGGDLNGGVEVVVDVAAVGRTSARIGRRPKPGDVLITPPLFGYTGLAFRAHERGDPAAAKGVQMLKRPLLDWPPPPPLNCVTASMDSSDGLADVLWTMARGVDIIVKALPAPVEVLAAAERLGLSPEEVVFNGGEEYLPIYAVRPECGVPEGYTAFAEVVVGGGAVIWRGGALPYKGWSY